MNSAKKTLLLPDTEGGERNGYYTYNHHNMLDSGNKPIASPPENRQGIFHPDRPMGNPDDYPWRLGSHRRIVR